MIEKDPGRYGNDAAKSTGFGVSSGQKSIDRLRKETAAISLCDLIDKTIYLKWVMMDALKGFKNNFKYLE